MTPLAGGSSATEDGRELLTRGYTGRILLVLASGFVLITVSRLVLSSLLPQIIADLAVSTSAVGLALSLMWLLTALAQSPGGQLADQLTSKTVVVASLGLVGVGALVLSQGVTFGVFVVGVSLLGLGAGLYPPSVYAQLLDLFEEKRGKAFGVVSAAIDLGGALAPLFATVVLLVGYWQLSFIPLFGCLMALLWFVHRWHRPPYAVARVQLHALPTIRRLLTAHRTRRLLVVFVLFSFVWQGSISFLPTLLQVEKGYPPPFANAAFAAVFVVGIPTKLVTGHLRDRFGYRRVVIGTSIIGTVGLLVVLTATPISMVAVGVVLFAIGLEAFWPVMNITLMEAVPDATAAGDYGMSRTIFVGLGSVAPAYVGFVADTWSFSLAFTGLFGCLLCGLVVLARV